MSIDLKSFVKADIQRAIGLIKYVYPDPIDPQFRIATPDGDLWLGINLPDNIDERTNIFVLIKNLLAYKQAVAFTLATEIVEPDGIICVGVERNNSVGLFCSISREPLNFAAPVELSRASIDKEIIDLLPVGSRSFDKIEIQELQKWFGKHGRYPLVDITTLEPTNL